MNATEALEALDRDIARHEARIAEEWRGTEKIRLGYKVEGMKLARTYLANVFEDRPMDTDPTVANHNASVRGRMRTVSAWKRGVW